MKKYRVEFNTTGFYSGQGVFEVLDETAVMYSVKHSTEIERKGCKQWVEHQAR